MAKDEFAKYFNGKNEVVLKIDDYLHFETHVVTKDEREKLGVGDILVLESGIYCVGIDKNHCVSIIRCDMYGKNAETVYKKQLPSLKRDFYVDSFADGFFIEYYTKDWLTHIDKYTLSTNTYESIAVGKNLKLSDYTIKEDSRYKVEVIKSSSFQDILCLFKIVPWSEIRGYFVITDTQTGVQKTIDDIFLQNTEYIDSMLMFEYGAWRSDISNGHILLTYSIGAYDGTGWGYAFLVFEYDFETDDLEYKALVYPYDSEGIDMLYIGDG